MFHNWTYAGWVSSKRNQILPKTIRGEWEPLITTEEFERGQEILDQRNKYRSVRRRQEYLLQGMIVYEPMLGTACQPLTCSTSNAGRSGGGTAYYRISRAGGVSFMCSEIDIQISYALCSIQVDPELIPSIRAAYTQDLAAKLGYLKPDQKEELRASLKLIDEEEARMVRLLASGRISEGVWDGLWREWKDRRSQIHKTLDLLEKDRAFHIDNLDAALQVIAQIGTLYNGLQRSEQKQLLRQVIDRVVVNEEGIARLELRAPFAYLNNLSDEIIKVGKHARGKQKTGREIIPTSLVELCSTQLRLCWTDRNLSEQSPSLNRSTFIQRIQFPYHAHLVRLSTLD